MKQESRATKDRWAFRRRPGIEPRDVRAHWLEPGATVSACQMLAVTPENEREVQTFATESMCRASGVMICGSCRQLHELRRKVGTNRRTS